MTTERSPGKESFEMVPERLDGRWWNDIVR